MSKLSMIKEYARAHTGQLVVMGIMTAVTVGIGIAAGMHPLDALAHGRR